MNNIRFPNVKESAMLLIIISMIAMQMMGVETTELYNSISLLIIGFFFGDSMPSSTGDKKETSVVESRDMDDESETDLMLDREIIPNQK